MGSVDLCVCVTEFQRRHLASGRFCCKSGTSALERNAWLAPLCKPKLSLGLAQTDDASSKASPRRLSREPPPARATLASGQQRASQSESRLTQAAKLALIRPSPSTNGRKRDTRRAGVSPEASPNLTRRHGQTVANLSAAARRRRRATAMKEQPLDSVTRVRWMGVRKVNVRRRQAPH